MYPQTLSLSLSPTQTVIIMTIFEKRFYKMTEGEESLLYKKNKIKFEGLIGNILDRKGLLVKYKRVRGSVRDLEICCE